jgi:hypothetical protein
LRIASIDAEFQKSVNVNREFLLFFAWFSPLRSQVHLRTVRKRRGTKNDNSASRKSE